LNRCFSDADIKVKLEKAREDKALGANEIMPRLFSQIAEEISRPVDYFKKEYG